jgi:hypothetical protein
MRIVCLRDYKYENSADVQDGSMRVENDGGPTDRQSGSLSLDGIRSRH